MKTTKLNFLSFVQWLTTNLDTSLSNWKVCWVCSCFSPRSLCTRTWRSASPGFSCAVSSGLSWSAPGSPVWLCVLTDSAWMWPVWQVNVRALWLELGIQRHDIWGISGCLHWQLMQHEGRLTFMYLTSISVFFSSSTITSLWNFLNCEWWKKTTNIKHQPKIYCNITHPATPCWITWLPSIRKKWSVGMPNNGFLRGRYSIQKESLIRLLWLKIDYFTPM